MTIAKPLDAGPVALAQAQAVRAMPAPPGGWPPADALRRAPRAAGIDPWASCAQPLEDAAAGVILTPPTLAHLVAWRLLEHWRREHPERAPRHVLDPAAGTGSLLLAIAARLDGSGLVRGVELRPGLAERARTSLRDSRLAPRTEIVCDDALRGDAIAPASVDLVIANPPFVPEKGNRALFRALAAQPRWRDRIGARCDLQYLFLHLVLDALVPGGCFGCITSAYWPTATGAARLRADLARRAEIFEVVDLGATRAFDGAPGHQTLLVFGRRLDPTARRAPRPTRSWWLRGTRHDDASLERIARAMQTNDTTGSPAIAVHDWALPTDAAHGATWHPRQSAAQRRTLAALDELGRPLADTLDDRQGIVSGADRSASDGPIFRFDGYDELRRLRDLAPSAPLVPLLRGSAVEPFGLTATPHPDAPHLLYLAGDEDPATVSSGVLEHLVAHRSRLERRREVELGRRPWWALQWPRDRETLFGPKLVCPRRARHAMFTLEWGVHAVSSDCTYLTPRDDARSLRELQLLLNSSVVDYQLQHRGKRKGNLIELYAAPLRAVQLPPSTEALQALAAAPHCVEPLSRRDRLATDLAVLAALDLPTDVRQELERHAVERWR